MSLFVFAFAVYIYLLISTKSYNVKATASCKYCKNLEKKYGFYIIGDSTSGRVYRHGLMELFNCTEPDRKVTRSFELVPSGKYEYETPAMVCNHSKMSRVGFMIHWGVAVDHYHENWRFHRSSGDSPNSVTNIMDAAKEFKSRSVDDDGIILIFLSNFWDCARRFQLDKKHKIPLQDFTRGFHQNFSKVIHRIKRTLSENDHLILQTIHHPYPKWDYWYYVPLINTEIVGIGYRYKIPVLRVDLLLGIDPAGYIGPDGLHQTDEKSLDIAKNMYSYISSLPNF